jgi:hypothetical protein
MPINLTDVNTYTPIVTVPSGGDARTAGSVQGAFQALANRTSRLKSRLDSPEQTVTITLSTSQFDFSPVGWSEASVVRLNPSGTSIAISGFDSSAVVKSKTIVNMDSSLLVTIIHDAGGQGPGNRVLAPGNASYVLGPRSAVEIIHDPVSLGWRVVGTSSLSALGPIAVIGAPAVTRLISPLQGQPVAGSGWSAGVSLGASGNMVTTVDAGQIWVPIDGIPSGCIITRVRMGITITGAPGAGGAPVMLVQRQGQDIGTGGISPSTVATVTGPIVAGNAVLSTGVLSETVFRGVGDYAIRLTAATSGATQTALNWAEVQFTDFSIWNG